MISKFPRKLPSSTATLPRRIANATLFQRLATQMGPSVSFDTVRIALDSFASAFEQKNRLVKLQIGNGENNDDENNNDLLLPQSVKGSEAISENYQYEIECCSTDAFIQIDKLLGQPAKLDILTGAGGGLPDARNLTISPEYVTRIGIISAASILGADGGFAKYALSIESPLSLLQHRRTSRIFQDKTVLEIVKTILDEHCRRNVVIGSMLKVQFKTLKTYPVRSSCTQYRVTDQAFIERILFKEGLAYRWEHGGATNTQTAKSFKEALIAQLTQSTQPLAVTLVIFDDDYAIPPASQETIRYHRADATEAEDAITDWTESREIGPGRNSLATWEYKGARVDIPTRATLFERADSAEAVRQAERTLEEYEAQAHHYGSNSNERSRYALLRQQARDRIKSEYHAQTNARQLRAGEWFHLRGHPVFDKTSREACEFIACRVDFTAHNNLPADLRKFLPPSGIREQESGIRKAGGAQAPRDASDS